MKLVRLCIFCTFPKRMVSKMEQSRKLHLNHATSLFLKALVHVNGIWLHVNISTHIADSINYAILNNRVFFVQKFSFFKGITVRGLNLFHIIPQSKH